MAQALSSSAAEATVRELVITRLFDAPRSVVFKAFTDSKRVAQWWGPHAFTNPVCELDARPGGALHIEMTGPEGSFPIEGTFHEVVEPERLVFSERVVFNTAFHGQPDDHLIEFLNILTFTEEHSKTRLTLHVRVLKSSPEVAKAICGMEQGWSESFERLGDVVANPFDKTPLAAREIVIRRLIRAPRELVFDAWTNPTHIGKWWGPHGFKTTTFAMDVRPGGVWDFVMHGPDGRDYKNRIEYLEVNRPIFLAYKHAGEGADAEVQFRSTVRFGETFGQTSVTLRMVFSTAQACEHAVHVYHAIEGGQQTLERLAQHAEKGSLP